MPVPPGEERAGGPRDRPSVRLLLTQPRAVARLRGVRALGRGLAGPSAVYLGAAAATAVVPFLVLPLLTRWLGPADFGVMGTLLAMINVAAALAGLSTHGRISVVYFRDGPAALPAQVGATLGVLALTAIPLLLLVLVAGDQIASVTGVPARWLPTVWIAACGQFIVNMTLAVWQARRQAWRYAATQIGFTLLWATATVALIALAGMTWTGRALGQAAAAIIAGATWLVVLTRDGCIDWNIRRWPVRAALAFGLPLLPHSLAAIAMSTIDRFALSGTAGEAATGLYFAAFQIAMLITAGAVALNQAWIPWLYARLAREDAAAKREVVTATYFIYALLLSVAAAMVVLAPALVEVVAGPEFRASAGLLAWLAPAAAFGGWYYFATGYLFYAGRTGVLSAITLGAAAVQVALTLRLVGPLGAEGVAIAALISSLVYWLATAIAAHRVIPMPWLGPGTTK